MKGKIRTPAQIEYMQKNVIILWGDASTYDNKKTYQKILTWLWSKISTLQQQNRELQGEDK